MNAAIGKLDAVRREWAGQVSTAASAPQIQDVLTRPMGVGASPSRRWSAQSQPQLQRRFRRPSRRLRRSIFSKMLIVAAMPPVLRKAMPGLPRSASAARSGSARSGPNGPTSRRPRSWAASRRPAARSKPTSQARLRGYCCLSSPTPSVTRQSDRWSSRSRALTGNSPVPVFKITGPGELLDLVRSQLHDGPANRD